MALIKGGILLNKVNKFVRYVKAAEPHERPFLKESPEFTQLDEDIMSFMYVLSPLPTTPQTQRQAAGALMNRQHFPTSLRDPLKHLTGMHKGIDADLIVSLCSASFPPSVLCGFRFLFDTMAKPPFLPISAQSMLLLTTELMKVRTSHPPRCRHLST